MDEIAWFRTADTYLGLFAWDELAADANLAAPTRGSFGGITLAINVESPRRGRRRAGRGGRGRRLILKPGTDLPFGYGGYFADPDGHPWEVCYNPGSRSARTGGSRSSRRPQAGRTTGRPASRAASASRSS